MSDRTIALDDRLYEYVQKTWLREPPVLRRLREETVKIGDAASMQISPEQGQLMATLLELMGARRVIEVGTFTGYSAIAMALAMPPDGKLITCETNPMFATMAGEFFEEAGVAGRIDLRLGPAMETLDALQAEGGANTFDAAFLDADKENYRAYYERLLQLLRPGGLLMVDNVLWDGLVADPSAQQPSTIEIRALNEKLRDDERVTLALTVIGDGLTLARKRR
jgi:caffeoyl-CoA O-methyltransferase